MTTVATREEEYTKQLQALGLWEPAFAGAVHDLCMLERDRAAARTAWRKAVKDGDKTAEALGTQLMKQDAAIQELRESLCLTPRALRRLRPGFGNLLPVKTDDDQEDEAPKKATVLELVRRKKEA